MIFKALGIKIANARLEIEGALLVVATFLAVVAARLVETIEVVGCVAHKQPNVLRILTQGRIGNQMKQAKEAL